MPEVKDVADKIAATWEEMKKELDASREERVKVGHSVLETEKKLDDYGNRLDELKKQLDSLGLKMARADLILPGGGVMTEEQKFRRNAFFKYVRQGRKEMEPAERKALVEDTTGLYLVPEELESEIVRGLPQINTLRNICRIRPTSRDKVGIRSLTEVSVGWGKLETGTEITETEQTPSKDTIYVEDLYALAKIGEDELMDSDANLMAILADSFQVAVANEEAKRFAIGRGHTTYAEPDGITLESISHIDWDTADTLTIDELLECEYNLEPQYLNGAAWLWNRKTEFQARKYRPAVASGYYGNYMWQPSLQVGQPNNFDGFPIYNQNDMGYAGETTDLIEVVFGNFKLGYMILDRSGLSIQRLDELYAEAGMVGFKIHKRVGGGAYRTAAFYGIGNANT